MKECGQLTEARRGRLLASYLGRRALQAEAVEWQGRERGDAGLRARKER